MVHESDGCTLPREQPNQKRIGSKENAVMDEKITRGMSLWDRIINDPEFLEMREAIQKRYGLPLNYDIWLHVTKWNKWIGGGKKKKIGRASCRERAEISV